MYYFIVYDNKCNDYFLSIQLYYLLYKKGMKQVQNIPHYYDVGFFLYLIKPVWQVTAYLEITFWWKFLISPLCSRPLTYRSTSNLYLDVGIKLFLFCFVKEWKQTSALWKIFCLRGDWMTSQDVIITETGWTAFHICISKYERVREL